MKVLVCIPCLLTGGTEIQTLNLVQALVEGGHEVTTVCYFEFSPEMVQRYEQAGSKVKLLSSNGTRPVGVWHTLTLLFKGLRRVVKSCHPDVAHVQYMAPGAIPIFILRLLGVKKIIATTHTAADIYPNLRLLHFVVKHILVAFQCITLRAEESYFGSSTLYSEAYELRKKGNHFTIYNALSAYIKPAEEAKEYHSTLQIGVVSRLELIKGMDLVVPAFANVHRKYPHTHLLVVGDGGQRELMERQCDEYGVKEVATFVGRKGQDELQSYYDEIDILLMPSRSEGFGLTAIEGMARGCVVVASNVGGLPEVVSEDSGVLFESESIENLTQKINDLIESSDSLMLFSKQSRKRVELFSSDRFSQNIQNLYRKLSDL